MKKSSRLLAFLVAITLLSLVSLPVMAEAPEEMNQAQSTDAQMQEIQELTARMEQANGDIPDDFTVQDMQTFIDQGDKATVDRIMREILENSIPMPMRILDDEDIKAQEGRERSNVCYSYDPKTGIEQKLPFDTSDPNTTPKTSEGHMIGDAAPIPTT